MWGVWKMKIKIGSVVRTKTKVREKLDNVYHTGVIKHIEDNIYDIEFIPISDFEFEYFGTFRRKLNKENLELLYNPYETT